MDKTIFVCLIATVFGLFLNVNVQAQEENMVEVIMDTPHMVKFVQIACNETRNLRITFCRVDFIGTHTPLFVEKDLVDYPNLLKIGEVLGCRSLMVELAADGKPTCLNFFEYSQLSNGNDRQSTRLVLKVDKESFSPDLLTPDMDGLAALDKPVKISESLKRLLLLSSQVVTFYKKEKDDARTRLEKAQLRLEAAYLMDVDVKTFLQVPDKNNK